MIWHAELPRPVLQPVCWECGHVFVERMFTLCNGCRIRRRHAERVTNLSRDRREDDRRSGRSS